jgi:hypothetical protein
MVVLLDWRFLPQKFNLNWIEEDQDKAKSPHLAKKQIAVKFYPGYLRVRP